ncbi:MAG: energy transducer TonB [Saprospiraceae bacterium]|nr:energy transducer TonB [Saprospiraceae bacterium]
MRNRRKHNRFNIALIISFFIVFILIAIFWNLLPLWKVSHCEKYRLEAMQKYEDGYLVLKLSDTASFEFINELNDFLIYKFENKLRVTSSLIIDPEEQCFYDVMDSLIKRIYGVDFLQKILMEKDSLDRMLMPGQSYNGNYLIVDTYPEFIEGMDSLNSILKRFISYPEIAINDSIQGKVYVELIIDTNGKIEHTKVIHGLTEEINKECLIALAKIDKQYCWTPGYLNGEKVKTRFYLPIKFELEKTD